MGVLEKGITATIDLLALSELSSLDSALVRQGHAHMPTSVYGALHETKHTVGWWNCFKNNFVNADLCCIQCCQTCICLPAGFLSEGFSSSLKTLYLSPESRTK